MININDKHSSVLAIGFLNFDEIIKIGTYPEPGGNAFIRSSQSSVGGCATNFLIGISNLGLEGSLMTKIGIDREGEFVTKKLSRYNIDTSYVIRNEEYPTCKILTVVDENGERTFFSHFKNSAIGQLSENEIESIPIENYDVIFGDGAVFSEDKPRKTILKAMRAAQKESVKCVFDPNLRVTKGKELPEKMKRFYRNAIDLADVLLLGGEEALLLTGVDKLKSAIKKISSFGPKIIGVKLGSDGSKIYFQNDETYIPPFDVMSVDTTGAGDAYNAGFVYGYLRKWDIEKTGKFANAVGALTVMKKGASSSPNLKQVKDFLESFNSRLFQN